MLPECPDYQPQNHISQSNILTMLLLHSYMYCPSHCLISVFITHLLYLLWNIYFTICFLNFRLPFKLKGNSRTLPMGVSPLFIGLFNGPLGFAYFSDNRLEKFLPSEYVKMLTLSARILALCVLLAWKLNVYSFQYWSSLI